MSISKAKRESLPSKDFGLPSQAHGVDKGESGNYPIDTPARARSALALSAAHATPEQQEEIRRRVHDKYPGMEIAGSGGVSHTDKVRNKR